MKIDTMTEIIIVGMSAIITLIAYLIFINIKKGKYDEENKRIVMEGVRNSFEKQIYALNERLIQSEERWRDINHLLIRNEYKANESLINDNRRTYLNEFLKANGVSENELIVDSRLVFVLTPFNDRYAEDFEVIKSVCVDIGFICIRGDESSFKSDLFPQMLKLILKARLIIANINGRNPNVMYELGIAQALDKPVLLVSKEPDNLPIDIKSKRFLFYKSYNELRDLIRTQLLDFNLR